MANQDNKALNIGTRAVDAARNLIDAIYAMRAVGDELTASQLNLSDYDALFAASGGLSHVDGQMLLTALMSAQTLYVYGQENGYNSNIAKIAL